MKHIFFQQIISLNTTEYLPVQQSQSFSLCLQLYFQKTLWHSFAPYVSLQQAVQQSQTTFGSLLLPSEQSVCISSLLFSFSSLLKAHTSFVTLPERSFQYNQAISRSTNLPISDGIVPVNLLFFSDRRFNFFICPIFVDIVPEKLFSFRYSQDNLVRSQSSSGIDPEKESSSNLNIVKSTILLTDVGMEPVCKLKPPQNSFSFGLFQIPDGIVPVKSFS
mmetsp:Transcript_14785/g.14978  ORF Transcript_14785/g.14978 Transcript_14785/m.14978 type:complete len:219 (-) Transcript_14785:766-1422(-)